MRVFVTGAETLTPPTGNQDANGCRFASVAAYLLWDLQNALGAGPLDGLAYDPNSDLAMFFNGSMDTTVIPDPAPLEVTAVATANALDDWGADWIYNLSEGIAPKAGLLADIAVLYARATDAGLGWIDAGSGACVCPQFQFYRTRAQPANTDFMARCSVIGYDFIPNVEWSNDGGTTWQPLPTDSTQNMTNIFFTCPGASGNFTLMMRDVDSPLVMSEPKEIVILPG